MVACKKVWKEIRGFSLREVVGEITPEGKVFGITIHEVKERPGEWNDQSLAM